MILCFRNKLIQIIQNGKLSLAIFIQVNLNMWDSFINRSFTVNFNRWICLNQTPFNEPLDCNNFIQLYTWWWALTENVNGSFSEVCPNRINYLVSVGIWLKGVVSSHLFCFVFVLFLADDQENNWRRGVDQKNITIGCFIVFHLTKKFRHFIWSNMIVLL